MSSSVISFIGFATFMVLALGGLLIAARKSRGICQEVEEVASRALPEIGGVAERKHAQRFGRAATNAPGANGSGSWYPQAKKKIAKHA